LAPCGTNPDFPARGQVDWQARGIGDNAAPKLPATQPIIAS
jgi:hypothetical protein